MKYLGSVDIRIQAQQKPERLWLDAVTKEYPRLSSDRNDVHNCSGFCSSGGKESGFLTVLSVIWRRWLRLYTLALQKTAFLVTEAVFLCQQSLVFLASVLLLSGCQSLESVQSASSSVLPVTDHPEVYLSRTISWRLPSVDIVEGSFLAVQSVSGRYADKQFDLIVQLEKKADELIMVGVTAMGQQLLSMEYKGGRLTSWVSPLLGDGVKPSYLISDFLLAFGSAERLRPLLADKQLKLDDNPGDHRVILFEGKPVVSMSYSALQNGKDCWPEVVKYRHDALGYELIIKTLSRERL